MLKKNTNTFQAILRAAKYRIAADYCPSTNLALIKIVAVADREKSSVLQVQVGQGTAIAEFAVEINCAWNAVTYTAKRKNGKILFSYFKILSPF